MDIVLQVFINAPTHKLETAADEAYRYKDGDIFQAFQADTIATKTRDGYVLDYPPNKDRFGYLFVTGAPEMDFKRFNDELNKRPTHVQVGWDADLDEPIMAEERADPRRSHKVTVTPELQAGAQTITYAEFSDTFRHKRLTALRVADEEVKWRK